MSWSSNDSLKLWVLILINGFSGVGKLFYFFVKFHLLQFVIWVKRHTFLTPLISQSALPEDGFSSVVWVAWHIFSPIYIFCLSVSHTLSFWGDEEMSLAPCETAAFSVLSQHVAVNMTPQQREKETGRFERKYGGHCCRTMQETMVHWVCYSCRRQTDLKLKFLTFWSKITSNCSVVTTSHFICLDINRQRNYISST